MHKAQHLRAPREVHWFQKAHTQNRNSSRLLYLFPNFQRVESKNQESLWGYSDWRFCTGPIFGSNMLGEISYAQTECESLPNFTLSGPVSHHEHGWDTKLPDTFLEHHSSHSRTLRTSPVNWTHYKAFWGIWSTSVILWLLLSYFIIRMRTGFGLKNRAWHKTFSLVK